MRIALDAMGGDYAPEPNITGAIAALEENPELEVVLVGDQPELDALLSDSGYSNDRLTISASEGVVGMEEKPTLALRNKPNCSISVCWRLMADREVDGIVSAGSTGAVVAAGLRTRLFLKGVKRPGIAVVLPTMKGPSILMDVGANPSAKPEHLYQYAVMGEIYAREVLGIESPSVGLMNIGSEDGKGTDLYRETHNFLSESSLKDCYVGNVEGRGLYQGDADVLICEGFVGNVVLKVSEGMAEFMIKRVAQEAQQHLNDKNGSTKKFFDGLVQKYQYTETGGAPLLGIDGVTIICHGSSNSRSITNAIKVATTFKDRQINEQIVSQLSNNSTAKQTA